MIFVCVAFAFSRRVSWEAPENCQKIAAKIVQQVGKHVELVFILLESYVVSHSLNYFLVCVVCVSVLFCHNTSQYYVCGLVRKLAKKSMVICWVFLYRSFFFFFFFFLILFIFSHDGKWFALTQKSKPLPSLECYCRFELLCNVLFLMLFLVSPLERPQSASMTLCTEVCVHIYVSVSVCWAPTSAF